MHCKDTTQILQSPGQSLSRECQQSGGWEMRAVWRGGHRVREGETPQTRVSELGRPYRVELMSWGDPIDQSAELGRPHRLEYKSWGDPTDQSALAGDPHRSGFVSRGPHSPEHPSQGDAADQGV